MKALTIRQPWATLVAIGAKRIETRSWSTAYRGPLAIHAAAGLPAGEAARLCTREPFRSVLLQAGYILSPEVEYMRWRLPRAAVLAVVQLVECRRIEWLSQVPAYPEERFGDYRTGRYMWLLRDPVSLPYPVPARGRLGLWDWEPPAGMELPGASGGGE